MRIILFKDVPKVGRKGEVVEISGGYARNFIIPQKFGQIADEKIINEFKQKKEKEKKDLEKKDLEIKEIIPEMEKHDFVFDIKTGKEGEIFSSVHDTDIKNKVLDFIKTLGKDFSLEEIHFESKPIKELGKKRIGVKLGRGEIAKNVFINIDIKGNDKK